YVLSVVNRFDEALNNDGAGQSLDDLIRSQTGTVSESGLQVKMRGLWCLVGANRELTGRRKENAFLVSALLGQYLSGAELREDEAGMKRLRARVQDHVREMVLGPRLHAATMEANALDNRLADPGKGGAAAAPLATGAGGTDIARRVNAARERLGQLIKDAEK